MDEVGADLSHHHPKSFDDLEDGSFDLVVSLTPEAQHRAVELARGRAVEIEYWPTEDPTLVNGSREASSRPTGARRDQLGGANRASGSASRSTSAAVDGCAYSGSHAA